jgi:hypothetical protein
MSRASDHLPFLKGCQAFLLKVALRPDYSGHVGQLTRKVDNPLLGCAAPALPCSTLECMSIARLTPAAWREGASSSNTSWCLSTKTPTWFAPSTKATGEHRSHERSATDHEASKEPVSDPQQWLTGAASAAAAPCEPLVQPSAELNPVRYK